MTKDEKREKDFLELVDSEFQKVKDDKQERIDFFRKLIDLYYEAGISDAIEEMNIQLEEQSLYNTNNPSQKTKLS